MRNYIKEQILGVADSLISADKMLSKIIRQKNNAQNVLILLQDMQAAAVEIGDAVEKSQDEAIEVIHMLEDYCELLWEISQSPVDEQIKLCEVLHKKLEAVRKQIKDNIPVEFEIVFLPYKVCMWDSLESVWLAAKEDSSCSVYVIPIPYFDKKEDKSFGEMHYEGGQFPEYVPVTAWDQYDFENRRPDIIYIHNPYDEYNNMTSVHPFFYSNSLKQYTDKLVYIPYYICSESTREANCLQTGIYNADVVILQSEKIKDEYIKYYCKAIGEDVPVNKYLALGAPKFDKAIRSSKVQNELTIQWKQRAGSRKIILYNTHLKSFFKYEEKAVEKLETVFQYFAERDDVLLLWRPHPLSKAALQSMRPELYEAYIKAEKEYLEKNIGIFDESEDIYSAISAADGYYGDSSSVLSLFGVTGKPICIQDVLVTDYNKARDNYLRFEAACIDHTKIYFANKDYNALAVMDIEIGKIHYIDKFPDNRWNQERIASNMIIWKEKLWMLPLNQGRVYSYDILSGKWCTFEMKKQWLDASKQQTFLAGKQVGRYYYGFGAKQYGIIKLDLETGEMNVNQSRREAYEQLADKNIEIICRQDCCEVEGKLYTACFKANLVLEYNPKNEKIELYQIGDEHNRYLTIAYDGTIFWITTKAGNLIRWNKETGDTQEITIKLDGLCVEGEKAFGSSLYAGGYVWLFAYSANMNIRVNIQTCEVEKVYEFTDLYEKKNPFRVLKSWYENGKVCFVDAYNYSIVQIDEKDRVNEFKLFADKNFHREMGTLLNEVWKADDQNDYRDYIHRESDELFKNLQGYLDYITAGGCSVNENQRKCFLRFTKYPEGNSGEIIHRKMTGKE